MDQIRNNKHIVVDQNDVIDNLDQWARDLGFSTIAGVDEVGRGPLAGPVVAAAVVLPLKHGIQGIKDSKKLSPKERQRLNNEIRHKALGCGVGVVDQKRIDAINIRNASLEAMSKAFVQLLESKIICDVVLVDGRDPFRLPTPCQGIKQLTVIKADNRSETVAAASIVAKVYRDTWMERAHDRWPQYGFNRHKGYPTKVHLNAIQTHGPCTIHRKTFRGVIIG